MLVMICLLAGVGLALCGIGIACSAAEKRRARNTPPPLPPRVGAGISTPSVNRISARAGSTSTNPLPPRRSPASAAAGADRGTNSGPRGIRPEQFPCCPYDKQRNIPGSDQVIFWDGGANCYRCSRGHRFKSNGKLM